MARERSGPLACIGCEPETLNVLAYPNAKQHVPKGKWRTPLSISEVLPLFYKYLLSDYFTSAVNKVDTAHCFQECRSPGGGDRRLQTNIISVCKYAVKETIWVMG